MTLFKSKFTALEKQLATITTERDGLLARVTTLEGQISASGDLPAQLASITTERDTQAEQIKSLGTQIETLKAGAKTADVIGSERAVDIASAVSVPPVSKEVLPAAGGKLSGDAVLSTYEAMTDPVARHAFFVANKAAIYAAQAAR